MSDWNGGYVADVAYMDGFYPQQSPARMVLAALLGGVSAELPAPADEVCYLELGCGTGIGALVTAAANPTWNVIAVDYNPAHVAAAIGIARAARIENVRFIEADLATLAASPLAATIPTADYVTMHGVWSWVGPAVRAGILRLLAARTRPGCLVHVSYNSLPGWQGGIGLQRLIYEAGRRASSGRSDRRAEAGAAVARELKAVGAYHLLDTELAREIVDRTLTYPAAYLTHEYMNAHWSPAFHADVAAAMAEAKLDWVASAEPLENFPALILTPEQREAMNRYDDPAMQELIKDICAQRGIRHDIYVRGARRLSAERRDAEISRLTLFPSVHAKELVTTMDFPAGKAEVSDTLGRMLAAALEAPATVGEILAREPVPGSAAELAAMLVGSAQCHVAPQPDREQPEPAHRLNRILGGRVTSLVSGHTAALVSGKLGTGLAAPPLVQFVVARLLNGEGEDDVETWLSAMSGDIIPEKLDTVRKIIHATLEDKVPVLRRLGIVPGQADVMRELRASPAPNVG